MRMTIADKKTGKLAKIIEVMIVDPDQYNECRVYVTDMLGRFITLVFPTVEVKRQALQSLNSVGYCTTFCDMYYYQEPMEQSREIDPFEIEEDMEYGYR